MQMEMCHNGIYSLHSYLDLRNGNILVFHCLVTYIYFVVRHTALRQVRLIQMHLCQILEHSDFIKYIKNFGRFYSS